MKQYIVVDDRFKVGQYLLGIVKSLMPTNKSVLIISEEELADRELLMKMNESKKTGFADKKEVLSELGL
ncbi:MAG: hypothetical protein KAH10_04405 [Flavobacteriales bacterium]|nr:hypothetical protein [Flavobacteriales bacterium]